MAKVSTKKKIWLAPAFKTADGSIVKPARGPVAEGAGIVKGFLDQENKWHDKLDRKTQKKVTWETVQACIRGEAVTKKGKPKQGRGRPSKQQAQKKSYDISTVAPITDAINDEFTDFVMDKIKKEYGVSIPKNNKARAAAQALYSRLRSIERDRMQAIQELKAL